ncbi:MAG TPA: acyl-CoA dehydrogenase family protein [Acidimicrobiia bacterium]|nr:acyl-CoA dehydrogenase family protein [Acidimicrobiia bacterium]
MLSVAELAAVRTALHSGFTAADGGDVTTLLDDFGWADMLASDPGPAVAAVFGLLGSTGATAGTLGDVMRVGLSELSWPASTVLIPPPSRRWSPPAAVSDDAVTVDALCIAPPAAGLAAVAAQAPDGALRLALVAVDRLDRAPADGLDPWLGLVRLRGTLPATDLAAGEIAVTAWRDALSWGRLALAAQLTGLVEASLTLAADHARARCQFGRPVGTFQAVQHRLADIHVALEAARATVDAAVESCRPAAPSGDSFPAQPDAVAAMVAKSMAGRAATVAAANALQVLAGIGFTWEHPLHRYQKRGLVLDRLLGASRNLPEAIGAALVARGEIPTLVDL